MEMEIYRPMTLVEARELLRIDEEATHDQVRRAYLRLVKVYKPERDPEGFRRLREAFERVESATTKRNLVGGHLVSVLTGEDQPEISPSEVEREPEIERKPPVQVGCLELDLVSMLVRAR